MKGIYDERRTQIISYQESLNWGSIFGYVKQPRTSQTNLTSLIDICCFSPKWYFELKFLSFTKWQGIPRQVEFDHETLNYFPIDLSQFDLFVFNLFIFNLFTFELFVCDLFKIELPFTPTPLVGFDFFLLSLSLSLSELKSKTTTKQD